MSDRRLGIVLAGGLSRRFGSDKALALADGIALINRAIATLSTSCDEVLVTGRAEAPVPVLADWPRSCMGPLGGVAAGLRHGKAHGYASILTSGVDSLGLNSALLGLLDPAPSYFADQPVVGHWPVGALSVLEDLLESDASHSMRSFADKIGARQVTASFKIANINTPSDLDSWERSHGI